MTRRVLVGAGIVGSALGSAGAPRAGQPHDELRERERVRLYRDIYATA